MASDTEIRPRHPDASEPRVSTGVAGLDDVLGELYWGDNVVWQIDGARSATPFYRAILCLQDAFDITGWVAVDPGAPSFTDAFPSLEVLGTAPGGAPVAPGDLLRQIRQRCVTRRRTLLLFDSLDAMVEAWGVDLTRGFLARCCPMLLELGAIAYWSMDLRRIPEAVQQTVESVTQCVLRLDRHSVQIMKAEGREPRVAGSLLHWDSADTDPVVTEAEVIERVAASLRAVRRPGNITQQQLAELAGVTASAISQAERAERGLSLATLVRLSSRLGVTLDELLRGDDSSTYRIGRRVGDPRVRPDREISLIDGLDSDVAVDLVHLGPREAGAPRDSLAGRAVVAVARGLVQIRIADRTPAVRDGEVLLTDAAAVRDWRNLADREAVLFWMVMART